MGADAAQSLRLIRQPSHADAQEYVRQALRQFNDTYVRALAEAQHLEPDMNALAVFLTDAAGSIQGGVLGYSQWGWLHIQVLWVAEEHRRQGYGQRLIEEAEQEARQRGCTHSRLATYSFQAPAFYEKLGYQVWGTLDGYPPGYTSYALRKEL